ncbi:MAG: hypothetical protein IPG35_09090 [Flavobacteriales bacterium]|nr:hypothetical protein [Flavobacteriales bacterium]MBK8949639.1 hypothetical protein [Flavobacteriales bacterium]MBK9700702.1 hypothetical protein [Flavobacteriales bacterium]
MIGTLFGKKKITEDRLANVFVNALLELVGHGFADVAAELNESPELVAEQVLDPSDDGAFLMTVLAGNLLELDRQLPSGLDRRLTALVLSKFAQATGLRSSDLEREVGALKAMMARLNHPSKNTVYAMSRALFHQYDLFGHQTDEYFRDKREPHPVTLKRLNSLMGFFLWDWENFHEHYRIAS